MPDAHSWGSIQLWVNRTTDYEFKLYKADGISSIALAATDVVRFKLGTLGSTPDLDLDSAGASTNSSSVTITNNGTDDSETDIATVSVRFAQGDTNGLTAGTYTGEISVVDDSETAPIDAIKLVSEGTVQVRATMSGDIAKT